jgi:E3 ubiquitin-protein ligase synoviolin
MKFRVYAFISAVILIGTVAHTFIQQEHFYPTVVALSQGKVQLTVIYNFLFMLLVSLMQGLVFMFVGNLTAIESEQLVENCRGMIADTLLFLIFYSPTINGKEVSTAHLVQFIGVILILKIFHSISLIRTGRMFEVGVPTNRMILRVGSLLVTLVTVDLTLLVFISGLLDKTSTFFTWLLFEFINITIASTSTSIKFVLNLIDARIAAQGWPSKSVYIFYTDLLSDILQMTSYMVFMGIFFYQNPSRLPIYAIADVLQVARQLAGRLKSFKRYREITSNMEARFPNATEEEMSAAESCIICRDALREGCKVLQCGHIFHTDCLKNWAVVQQICPTCRADLAPREKRVQEHNTSPVVDIRESPNQANESVPGRNEETQAPAAVHSPQIIPAMSSKDAPVAQTVSLEKLLLSINHAREMKEFYQTQSAFWSGEVRLIQERALPPDEPVAFRTFVDQLRAELSTRQITERQPISKSPSESELERATSDWDDIRKARQQRYEADLRQRKSPEPESQSDSGR